MNYKVALAQINSILGETEKNIQKHVEYVEKAIKEKANIIVFPELSLTGYVLRDLNFEVALNPYSSGFLKPLRDLSKYIDIVVGGVEEGQEYGLYNSAFYFSKGACQFVHRKIYLPTYGLFEEQRYFTTGKELHSFNTDFGKIGILICEDFWHPTLPYILAKQGAFLILGLSASPTRISPGQDELNQFKVNSEFHHVYARLLSLYVAWCNKVGFEEGMNFWGGSEIVSPLGESLSIAKFFDEDMIINEINNEQIKKARLFSKHFVDDDIFFTFKELRRIIDNDQEHQ